MSGGQINNTDKPVLPARHYVPPVVPPVGNRKFEQRGTMMYWLCPSTPGWNTDEKEYRFEFPTAGPQDVRVDSLKHPDKTLEVVLKDDAGPLTSFRVGLPELQPSPEQKLGVHIAMTWENGEAKLYLNSDLVQTNPISSHYPKPS